MEDGKTKMEKKLIWTVSSRAMHAMFVLFFALAWLTSDNDMVIRVHIVVGFMLGWLALFRIVLGFAGSGYSKFSSFPFGFSALKNYFLTLFTPHDYGGHNPASAWSAILMLVLILLTAVSGALAYFYSSHAAKEAHEFLAFAATAVVIAHVCGAILSAKINGADAVLSMVNGLKKKAKSAANPSLVQKVFASLGIIGVVGVGFGAWSFIDSYEGQIRKEAAARLPKEYVKECASCHSLYPSSFLGAESWTKVFDNLDKHFGTDASLDEELTKTLKEYAVSNAGPDKNSRFSMASSAHLGIEITKTEAWKRKHEDVPKELFLQKKSRPSNCVACHKDANCGIIRPANISVEDKRW